MAKTVMRVPALAIIAAARPGDRVEYMRPNGIGRYGPEWKPARGREVKIALGCIEEGGLEAAERNAVSYGL